MRLLAGGMAGVKLPHIVACTPPPYEARGEARGGGRSLGQHPSGHIYSCNIKIVAAFASATCYLSAVRHFTAKGQRDDDGDDGDDEGRTQSKI